LGGERASVNEGREDLAGTQGAKKLWSCTEMTEMDAGVQSDQQQGSS
jgi:hypothetical protein